MRICKIFFCVACSKGSVTEEEALKCDCDPRFLTEGIFTPHYLKNTRWQRFLRWFWSLDITYWLAFMSMVIINSLLVSRVGLSFKELLLESVCMGLLIPRLLNNEPK